MNNFQPPFQPRFRTFRSLETSLLAAALIAVGACRAEPAPDTSLPTATPGTELPQPKPASTEGEGQPTAAAAPVTHAPCPKPAQTQLFGAVLACATRAELRRAVASAGARPQREDDAYWVDVYDSATVLDESSTLQLTFVGATGEFARAVYEFPAHMDTDLVERVARRVGSKYGTPSEKRGMPGLGEVSYGWNLGDGIRLRVFRGWPDTTTFLEYVNPPKLAAAEREIAASQARQQAARNQAQAAAF